ncbi:MAG TPA: cation:dicarboxylase symporter family transporter, partial [Allosphingosinicella sp.]|nr:cation:dicarboxylase symporter family transporter [Allosphingosinicella sp.]
MTRSRPFWRSLYAQVLVAIALGVLVGWLFPAFGASLKPLGDAFIKLVKMIITPVIFLTVTTGIAGMSDLKAFGRVGAKAMAYFLTFSTLALAVGLVVANVVRPGDGLNVDPAALDQGAVATYVDKAHEQSITGFLLNIVPDTFFSAFTSGQILQVLFVSILFGIALALLGERGERVLGAMRVLTAAVFRMVHILMYAAPLGAFGAMAYTIGAHGI